MVPCLFKIRRRILLTTTVAVCLLIGCGGRGLRLFDFSDLPVRSATPEELVAKINRDAASLQGLKGKLGMGLQKQTDKVARRCSGMLLAESGPRRGLHLKGYKRLIPTFFTLVSDGEDFWFHIPRDDVVYTGPVDFAWSSIFALKSGVLPEKYRGRIAQVPGVEALIGEDLP
jgi:hypothetical protein